MIEVGHFLICSNWALVFTGFILAQAGYWDLQHVGCFGLRNTHLLAKMEDSVFHTLARSKIADIPNRFNSILVTQTTE